MVGLTHYMQYTNKITICDIITYGNTELLESRGSKALG